MNENKKSSNLSLIIVIVLVVVGVVLVGFMINGNKENGVTTNNIGKMAKTRQEFNGLNFKLPDGYRILKEENNELSYVKDVNELDSIHLSITINESPSYSSLQSYSEEKINNVTWYTLISRGLGLISYTYLTEKDGIEYHINIGGDDSIDQSILEKDIKEFTNSLNFN